MGQSHRGAHQEDRLRFDPTHLPVLRRGTDELSWLLSRGYSIDSALTLVGDRYQLHARQRLAVRRAACSDVDRDRRIAHRMSLQQAADQPLRIDGFNLLITVEAALSGGLLIRGRDRCLRDLASVHGTWRAVQETGEAIERVGRLLADLHAAPVLWYLDRPVSNSGRLRQLLEEQAMARGWPWSIQVVFNPDRLLCEPGDPVVSSDGVILSRAPAWVDLIDALLARDQMDAWIIDLSAEPGVDSGTDI